MFYFDEEEEGEEEWGIIKPISSPTSNKPNQNPKISILQDILKRITHSETVILEKILLYLGTMEAKTGNEQSKLNQGIVQRLMKDGFKASLCKSSWAASTFSRPSGFDITVNYEYIDVMMREKNINDDGGGSTVRLIVDMDFKSQFELARPTKAYTELSNSLPCVFVGTEEKLINIITLLCSAAKRSLKNRGLHIPPWRRASYMQSKWLSENCEKVSVSSVGS